MNVFDVLAAAVIALSSHPLAPAEDATAICQYEDGNTDGTPCTWFDPDTGDRYFVDSGNYRQR